MATAPAPNLGLMGRTGPQANSKLTTKPTRVMCTQNAKHAKGPKNKGSRGQVQVGFVLTLTHGGREGGVL